MTAKQASRVASLLPNGQPKYVRAYDNGGISADRYIVLFTGRYRNKTGGSFIYLAMSERPFHPQGFGQHGESQTQFDTNKHGWPPAMGRSNHLGKRILFSDLPPDCQKLVLSDYRDLWNLPKE